MNSGSIQLLGSNVVLDLDVSDLYFSIVVLERILVCVGAKLYVLWLLWLCAFFSVTLSFLPPAPNNFRSSLVIFSVPFKR